MNAKIKIRPMNGDIGRAKTLMRIRREREAEATEAGVDVSDRAAFRDWDNARSAEFWTRLQADIKTRFSSACQITETLEGFRVNVTGARSLVFSDRHEALEQFQQACSRGVRCDVWEVHGDNTAVKIADFPGLYGGINPRR